MEEPDENRFMMTSPVFWYTGALLMLLGVHYGKPRLFFSAKPTIEGVLCSLDKFKVSTTVHTYQVFRNTELGPGAPAYLIQIMRAFTKHKYVEIVSFIVNF